jgi:hypothetical protein
MDYTRVLDLFPLWVLCVATVAVVALSIESGFRLGKYRRSRTDQEKDAPVGVIVASTLGLLGFMLAFTFGLAASRFDARRQVVLEESNAIGTAYLRAGLLPEPNSAEIRRLFQEYVDVRLQVVQSGGIEQVISKSADLHRALWRQTTEVAAKDSRSILTGLFIQSLNEVIDLHSKRALIGLHSRIPEIIWLALYFIAVLAMGALGYQEGLAGSRRSLAVPALALTFSAVMLLIADLDRPQEGLLRVSQQAMVDLQNSLKDLNSKPERATP